jgi:DNA polymerase-3 subunit epsilon
VLRRLAPRPPIAIPDGVVTRLGLFVDVETTGLDWRRDEIIELAMIPFRYGLDGRIYEIGEAFQGLRQPAQPISAEITALTGIDDAMVAGKTIDLDAVAAARRRPPLSSPTTPPSTGVSSSGSARSSAPSPGPAR